jgi:hypothetical protein
LGAHVSPYVLVLRGLRYELWKAALAARSFEERYALTTKLRTQVLAIKQVVSEESA